MNDFFYTQNLNRYFGGINATNNVNLLLHPRQLRSIIGPNGAGKTTLINLITGRIPANSGKVIYKGEDVTNTPSHVLVKKGICRTFQISSIFPDLTVFENVRIARQACLGGSFKVFSRKHKLQRVNEDAWNILQRLDLSHVSDAIAKNLAYGDQRVLEVAIALCSDPEVLFLDEPTAGMSPTETKRTTELIKQLTAEVSVVLIEHDMEVVMRVSDYITVLHQGAIIAEGTPSEIKQNEEVKEAYLGGEDE